jgi:hypothetical protein
MPVARGLWVDYLGVMSIWTDTELPALMRLTDRPPARVSGAPAMLQPG